MQIEIHLKKLLTEIAKDERGIIQELATYTGVHRHTIEALLHNRAPNPSLRVLGQICDWLQEHGIPSESLPHALFGRGPQQLWEACTRRGAVTLYLGQTPQPSPSLQDPFWISGRDTALAFKLIQALSDPAITGRRGTAISTKYVPYYFPLDSQHCLASQPQFSADVAQARQTYHELKRTSGASILIGAVKTNYLVEYLVAELFGCLPFQTPSDTVRPPMYMQYRETDRKVPSCMAGTRPPAGFNGDARPGFYYLASDCTWQAAPWSDDTGLVLVSYDLGTQEFLLAACGFRGRTTMALAEPLTQTSGRFWPETECVRGRRVGIYLCGFSFEEARGKLEWGVQISLPVLRDRLVI